MKRGSASASSAADSRKQTRLTSTSAYSDARTNDNGDEEEEEEGIFGDPEVWTCGDRPPLEVALQLFADKSDTRPAFITGAAGTGKTELVRGLVEALRGAGLRVAVTAMTGTAAAGVDGNTLQSHIGFSLEKGLQWKGSVTQLFQRNERIALAWSPQHVDAWFIDETSMLTDESVNELDNVGRRLRDPDKPFGGLFVFFVGDFLQLPPIIKNDREDGAPSTTWRAGAGATAAEKEQAEELQSKFAFRSPVWRRDVTRVLLLTKVWRQSKEASATLLAHARRGDLTDRDSAWLSAHCLMSDLEIAKACTPTRAPSSLIVAATQQGLYQYARTDDRWQTFIAEQDFQQHWRAPWVVALRRVARDLNALFFSAIQARTFAFAAHFAVSVAGPAYKAALQSIAFEALKKASSSSSCSSSSSSSSACAPSLESLTLNDASASSAEAGEESKPSKSSTEDGPRELEWITALRDVAKPLGTAKEWCETRDAFQASPDVQPLLLLRAGAPVILSANLDVQNNLTNGSHGVILGFLAPNNSAEIVGVEQAPTKQSTSSDSITEPSWALPQPEHVFCWSASTREGRYLSPFTPAPSAFTIDATACVDASLPKEAATVAYGSIETAFQAMKQLYATPKELARQRHAKVAGMTSKQAKRAGKLLDIAQAGLTLDVNAWTAAAPVAMRVAVLARAACDPLFTNMLLDAQRGRFKWLHQESRATSHSLWGGRFTDEGTWIGHNLLGEIYHAVGTSLASTLSTTVAALTDDCTNKSESTSSSSSSNGQEDSSGAAQRAADVWADSTVARSSVVRYVLPGARIESCDSRRMLAGYMVSRPATAYGRATASASQGDVWRKSRLGRSGRLPAAAAAGLCANGALRARADDAQSDGSDGRHAPVRTSVCHAQSLRTLARENVLLRSVCVPRPPRRIALR